MAHPRIADRPNVWQLVWLIVAVIAVAAVAGAILDRGYGGAICIEGGVPPHCAGPGGPPRRGLK